MSKRENNGNKKMKDTSVRVTGNKPDAWRMLSVRHRPSDWPHIKQVS